MDAYFINLYFIFWVIIFLFSVIFELLSPGLFFFLAFAFGALIAAVISLFNLELTIQLIAFIISSIISFICLKFSAAKLSRGFDYKTNVEAMIGKKAIVAQDIKHDNRGYVKFGGELWQAQSVDNTAISVGQEVEIIRAQGVHLIVKKL